MWRNTLSIVLALPAASALSLANFQQITSSAIPQSCIATYDKQIPACTQNDFNNGCSPACVTGLNNVAGDVSDACSEVDVSPNTLLGFVLSGDIIQALCPKVSTTTSAKNTPTQVNSVTIPTDSQGVTGGLGLKTTTPSVSKTTSVLTSSTSSSLPSMPKSTRSKSSTSDTQTSTSTTTSDATTTSTAAVAGGGEATSSTSSTQTSKTSSKTKSPTSTSTSSGGNVDDGQGSPFDIGSQSGASLVEIRPFATTVVMIFWAGVFFVR